MIKDIFWLLGIIFKYFFKGLRYALKGILWYFNIGFAYIKEGTKREKKQLAPNRELL
jgi:hypothetical protein